jgi:hypothetical protein
MTSWGGKRKGAGRPSVGKKVVDKTIRFDEELLARIAAYGEANTCTFSESVRRLINEALVGKNLP